MGSSPVRVTLGTVAGSPHDAAARPVARDVANREAARLVSEIVLYGRPWPYMALVRDRLARSHPDLTDPDLGSAPYAPEAPPAGWIDGPPRPPLAEDVAFYSPL